MSADDPVDEEDPTGLATSDCTGSRAANAGGQGGEGTCPGLSGGSTASPTGNTKSLVNQKTNEFAQSSQTSHIGMNGLLQSGPPPQIRPVGDTGATMQDAVEESLVMQGKITQSEWMERREARANGALTGLAVVEGGLALRGAVGALARVVSVEGAGKGAQYGLGRIGQIRFGGGRLILRLDRPPRTGGFYHFNIESHSLGINWHIPVNPVHWFGF